MHYCHSAVTTSIFQRDSIDDETIIILSSIPKQYENKQTNEQKANELVFEIHLKESHHLSHIDWIMFFFCQFSLYIKFQLIIYIFRPCEYKKKTLKKTNKHTHTQSYAM